MTGPGEVPGPGPGGRSERIRAAVQAALAPVRIELADESARHAGHAGMRDHPRGPGGAATETHYALLVVSAAFEGLGRVQRARRVHELLAVELAGGLHALSLTLRTPAEDAARG